MNVDEYIQANDTNVHAIAQATGIAYSTLHPHVKHGKALSLETAKRLEEWSGGKMTAIEILALTPPGKGKQSAA